MPLVLMLTRDRGRRCGIGTHVHIGIEVDLQGLQLRRRLFGIFHLLRLDDLGLTSITLRHHDIRDLPRALTFLPVRTLESIRLCIMKNRPIATGIATRAAKH
jgi:hypothetical protein